VRVLSVCRYLPDPGSPAAGGFVFERLAAMAALTPVTILQPVPYFPVLRPLPGWAGEPGHEHAGRRIEHAPMFYLPGLLKSLDATWLERSVRRALPGLGGAAAFDVVDAHFGYPDGVGCVRLARRDGLPVFVTVRGLETDVVEDPSTGPQLVRALNEATGVISVSHSLRDLLVSRGVEASQFRVIPNAVDRQRFRPGDRSEARARLGIPPDAPLVVCVGNLIELKRHHVLIEAFARLRATWPTAQLAIIGGGEAEPAYEARLRRLECDRRRRPRAFRRSHTLCRSGAVAAGRGPVRARDFARGLLQLDPGGARFRPAGGHHACGRQCALRARRRERAPRSHRRCRGHRHGARARAVAP
jgi:glycosyltransferase involved in cell wall biosynthesis